MGEIITGDAREVLPSLDRRFDLAYVDPPFLSGKDYRYFDDRYLTHDAYLGEMRELFAAVRDRLAPTGSFWLHCDHHANYLLRAVLDEVFGNACFRNEIIWAYYGPGIGDKARRFLHKHDTLYWYSRSPSEWTFNGDAVRRPYNSVLKGCARSLGRKTGLGGGIFVRELDPETRERYQTRGKIPDSWWTITPVGPNAEGMVWPTQKPVALLVRIIASTSRPGDSVLDPCCGSGTTLVAAETLGRTWTGIDRNPEAQAVIADRMRSVNGGLPL